MDGRRSYLDSLNNGRQRRAQNTLDELSRSLERLGERLERRDEPRQPERSAHDMRAQRPTEDAGYRLQPEPAYRPAYDEMPTHAPRDDAYMATTGRLAAEVKGLRDELRHQMSAGLRREFDNLRGDIARAYSTAAANPRASAKLSDDLEQLSHSIQLLSEQSDDRGIGLLRGDIEQVKSEIEQLAREDTLRSFDSRWQDFDRRWNDLEHRIERRSGADAGMESLGERLQQINDAVNNLPESLSLKSLEDKVRTLAGAVDHFSRQQDDSAPRLFEAIDQRLDEISRAIVASSMAAQPAAIDFEPIERIETRISSLAAQLDELSNREPSAEILDRLSALSRRIDDVAMRADVPAKSVERLAGQIAIIADRMEQGSALPGADDIMRGIETRLDQFADTIERRQDSAFETSQAMFRELEARLFDVVTRLDQQPAPTADSSGLMDAIDQRLQDFSRKLESRRSELLDTSSMRDLEAKIDTMNSRMERAQPAATAVDPEVIRGLESQIAELSSFLSKPDQAAPIIDGLSPRLEQMEKAIRGSRDMVIDAARRAAEDVVRSFGGAQGDGANVNALTQDLKSLEAITRRSDDRNAKTFEAIHDTLLKIVDRLGSMEAAAPASVKLSVAETPSIAPMEMPSIEATGSAPAEQPVRAEAEAVVAAVDAPAADAAKKKRSMLGGLSRAFTRKKETEAVLAGADGMVKEAPKPIEPKLDLDEPLDPKILNKPLQPGSGAPDLSRIMKRVREERGAQPAKAEDAEAAKSDFIAAARRAAQAAAAEAEVLKRHSEIAGGGRGFKLGELLKARRKPILMGAVAIMIALTGLQLSKAFFKDRDSVAQSATVSGSATPAIEPMRADTGSAATAPVTPGQPAGETSAPRADARPSSPADTTASVPTEAGDADSTEPAMPVSETAASAEATASEPSAVETAALTPDVPVAAETLPPMPKAPVEAGPVALRDAADSGDPKAMFEIGSRYTDGRGIKADNNKAADWYERAAELGLAPAQYRIGNMYEKGIGVDRDLTKAKTWYQMSADQGNASAMHNLAVLYAMGADGTTDNESAARWFQKAGDLGVKDSQFNLGILNAKGVGMPQNLEESYKWFALVAKTGDRDAAAKRDEIANSLRPEQLDRAKAATELWKAKAADEAANVVDVPDAWRESTEKTASVDMKKAVQTIQLILNKNGYDAGSADGVMGQKTKNAIIAFQKDNNLPADGAVTEKLVQELLARK